ncbi:X-X-X-Leu-X-X-Gly heptad repeat-containing protein [Corynebacterium camporealensis]|uniref:X-X-X-Leu-X-X-Gly heptad repeat-containing protein n=1 Tax=Corynebacterium camporealensis TaxID=161896 RepID=A0A0F6QWL2_9CORY|nr:hypothetical protein [Corynebacterium camporealensis]AKE38163.1 X-X-X-Leu-X-X-Gly heptad repeat-containing protein [Corynebacterium camporealensis]AVH87481.1 X-X-X-Leu-X-X-Gly heptad repeat-containing protein [Corynebacterium camporealensis]
MSTAVFDSAASRPSRLKVGLLSLLVIVPLLIGAGLMAATGWQPAEAWTKEEVAGAPSAGESPEAALADARSKASVAQANSSLLDTGSQQLADGTEQLRGGAEELGGGIDELSAGSQQLVDGLTQLQAGTGQLGSGANELADNVGGAVDQVLGLGAVQGQILEAIDGTLQDLHGVATPEAKEIRDQLRGLRGQVETFDINESLGGDLNRLKDGSRELANQLSVPGYAYHDGIYQAVEGAKQLNAGIGELDGGVGEALDGVGQLDDGAQRINDMASTNQENILDILRVLPVAQEDAEPVRALSPITGLLIGLLTIAGGVALGVVRKRWWLVLLGTILAAGVGVGLLALFATGWTWEATGWAAGVLGLGVLATAMLTRAALALCGPKWGAVVITVANLIQLAVVGWVWKAATTTGIASFWQIAASVLPLHWMTTGVTVAGNDGAGGMLWASLGVLGAVAVLGSGAAFLSRR